MHDPNELFLRFFEASVEGLGGLPLFTRLPRRGILGKWASGDADSRKFKRLKTPQVACARELEPAPLDTQALLVWRYVLILHCGGGGAQNAL